MPTRAMGVEPRTARQMIEFGRRVKDVGLDAMQVYSLDMGHLGIPRPEELDRYFREVLEHGATMPAVISTHFSVGYMVPVDLLCTLCDEYDSMIGINCSIGQDFTYLVRLLDEAEPAGRGARRRPDAHALRAGDGRHRVPVVGGQPGPAARATAWWRATRPATTRPRPTPTRR